MTTISIILVVVSTLCFLIIITHSLDEKRSSEKVIETIKNEIELDKARLREIELDSRHLTQSQLVGGKGQKMRNEIIILTRNIKDRLKLLEEISKNQDR